MSIAAAPASAAPAINATLVDHGLVDTVQYGYGERRYEGRGYRPKPGQVVRRILGDDLVTGIAAYGAVVTDTAVVGITVPGVSSVTDRTAPLLRGA
jgi:hypothetical protein